MHRPQTEAEVLEQSAQTLSAHLRALLSSLSRSVRACPAVVRATFRQLFRRVRERFPSAQDEVRPLPVGLGGEEKVGGERSGGAPRCGRKGLMVRSRGRGREWEVDAERWGQRQRERGCQGPGLGKSSPQHSLTPPERALHRRHQLPVPALHLSCHHGAQALPPAGAARGRPHQPHPAPAGQGPGLWTLAGGAQLAAE